MSYFLTDEQYEPGRLYETDASIELIKAWLDEQGESLRLYFERGYVRSMFGDMARYVTASEMAQDIGIATAKRAIKKAARETYLSALSPEERYKEENTLHVQSLDHIMRTAVFPSNS